MWMRNFPYLIGRGTRNLFKHKAASFFSLLIMLVTIFLFSSSYSILMNIGAIVKNAQDNVGITVFFREGMTEEEIHEIAYRIGENEEVQRMVFTSAEEAWEEYKEVYFKGNEELAEGFADNNPLANSASYEIFLVDISLQSDFVQYLESIDGVRRVNYSNVIAEGMKNLGDVIRRVTWGVLAILMVVAVSLISNGISLTIAMRKDEIHVMRYVGATNTFILTPFLWEGALIGLAGSLIPLFGVFFLYDKAISALSGKLAAFGNFLVFLPRTEILKELLPLALGLGLGVGLLGSVLSIRKHVRV